MRRALLELTLAAALGLAVAGCAEPGTNPELEVLPLGGDFTLPAHTGRDFDLRELRGQAVWLFFGFTTCPDVCPTTLARLSQAHAELAPGERERVQAVFVSVDPDRDTPAVLAQYLGYFQLPAIGVSGPPEKLLPVVKSFAAHFERVESSSAAGYLIDHTTYVYLLDGHGKVRHLFGHDDPPARIAALTSELLRDASCLPTGRR